MSQSYITNLQSSSLSNQNITSALLLATYTNTSRARKMYIRVALDQIAGNGNYVIYAKNQYAGAGSAYEQGARTTVPVPSGVTAQGFPTIALMVEATDVITVFAIGLAGDTTTPDSKVDFFEEFVGVGADGNVLISTDVQDRSTTLSINTKTINGVATTSITTINANLGTTQPINFTGTAGSALAKVDVTDIATAAVSTSTAQLGVNAVNWAGGAIPAPAVTGVPKIDLTYILGTILTETAGQLAAAFKKFFNISTPASTMDALTLVATATNLTNAPTNGDFTAVMKTSLNSSTPVSVTTVTGNVNGNVGGNVVGNVNGNVLGNVVGSIGSFVAAALAQFFTLNSTKTYADAVSGSVVKEIVTNVAGGTAPTVQEIDTQLSGTHGAGQWGGGGGTGFFTVTLTVTIGGQPADGVAIIVANDSAGASIVAQAESDDNGNATVFLDAGSYYVFQQRAGDTFSPNPYQITVP